MVVVVVRVVLMLRVVVLRCQVSPGNHNAAVPGVAGVVRPRHHSPAAGDKPAPTGPHPHPAHPAAAAAAAAATTTAPSRVQAPRLAATVVTAGHLAAAGGGAAAGARRRRRRADVAGDLREGLLEAALDVGEGHDEQGALVPACEEDLLLTAGVEEGQALVHVAEVHHRLALGVHLISGGSFGVWRRVRERAVRLWWISFLSSLAFPFLGLDLRRCV